MNDPKAATIRSKIEGIDALAELALNLHWSWNHATDKLWRHLDPELWEATQNPWVVLQTVSQEKIRSSLKIPEFRHHLDDLLSENHRSYKDDAWFQSKHTSSPLTAIAYFSMEFMLSEALPIYSGGLGNVAGDQMKAASDLGVPVIGIGLLYGQGYFRQNFDAKGRQQVLYPVNDPGQLPIRPLRQPNGEWLRLEMQLPGSNIWLRCWEAAVGRTKLYLLDTNDFANTATHRGITSELYGGDAEMRLSQEIVLGIGGWRLLRALGIQPEVCHLNEGHAAFAILERARCYMKDHTTSFDLALKVTRAGNVFTTHTAVEAGFDRFDLGLVQKYLGRYAKEELALPFEDLLAMGRQNATDISECFNMAYLALHGSGQVNGVSKLHGQVSRKIFQPLFPRWPQEEVPIGSVTNGIHVPTWDSAAADTLWTAACGKKRWLGDRPVEDDIRHLTDAQLWQLRTESRKALIDRMRVRYARQLASEGTEQRTISNIFDENVMTIGFARRFAAYKRPNLLLHDPERLIRLLSDSRHPLQLILAGKAHPRDFPGQAMIEQWHNFIKRPEVCAHVVFLSDYDMQLAQEMVQGIDLWINTPLRPWEACGTSGMKVLVNGGLNLSELDGWWAEAYSCEVGWSIGDGRDHGDDPSLDALDAETLYDLLEREIAPEFYERNDKGMPSRWLGRIRESMAQLTSRFSAGRALREYTEHYYIPAANDFRERASENSKLGIDLLRWQQQIAEKWSTIRIGTVDTETHDDQHFFRVQMFPGDLDPHELSVELYANAVQGGVPVREVMIACEVCSDPNSQTYLAKVPATRPTSDFTPRVIPYHANASVPLETEQILWER